MKQTTIPKIYIVVGVAVLLGATAIAAHNGGPEGHFVTSTELADLLQRGEAVAVDVRTPGEYRRGHIPGALNIPFDDMDSRADEVIEQAEGKMIVLYCRTGRRAGIAEGSLVERGANEIHHLTGQMSGWAEMGLTVVRGE